MSDRAWRNVPIDAFRAERDAALCGEPPRNLFRAELQRREFLPYEPDERRRQLAMLALRRVAAALAFSFSLLAAISAPPAVPLQLASDRRVRHARIHPDLPV